MADFKKSVIKDYADLKLPVTIFISMWRHPASILIQQSKAETEVGFQLCLKTVIIFLGFPDICSSTFHF